MSLHMEKKEIAEGKKTRQCYLQNPLNSLELKLLNTGEDWQRSPSKIPYTVYKGNSCLRTPDKKWATLEKLAARERFWGLKALADLL